MEATQDARHMAQRSSERTEPLRQTARDPTERLSVIADIHSRLERTFPTFTMAGGACVHLIEQRRPFKDIDIVVEGGELRLNGSLSHRLGQNSFTPITVADGVLIAMRDQKTGTTVDAGNGKSLLDSSGRTLTQEEICAILGCKRDSDTSFGFPNRVLIGASTPFSVQIGENHATFNVLPPFYLIATKYNLARIRSRRTPKDLEDIGIILERLYNSSFGEFVRQNEGRISENLAFLGVDFATNLYSMLHRT